jgi:hypothetical protein
LGVPRFARAFSLSLALVLCAWFALGIRQASDTSQATTIVSGLFGQHGLGRAQAGHANSLLHSASVLNPDAQVEVLRARVALLRGDRARAKRILLAVVHSEPMNIDAWYGLATSAKDQPTVLRSLDRIAQLAPKKRRAP